MTRSGPYPVHIPSMPSTQTQTLQPPRISLADAIRLMAGLVSRTEFFTTYRHDPKIIRRLDIRKHPRKARVVHCDREAVLQWMDELRRSHKLALEPPAPPDGRR